jgi:hypothetical protein
MGDWSRDENAPAEWAKALWFAQLWTRGGCDHHGSLYFYYWLIRQGRATPYEYLSEAATSARVLGLVDADAFEGHDEEEERW